MAEFLVMVCFSPMVFEALTASFRIRTGEKAVLPFLANASEGRIGSNSTTVLLPESDCWSLAGFQTVQRVTDIITPCESIRRQTAL